MCFILNWFKREIPKEPFMLSYKDKLIMSLLFPGITEHVRILLEKCHENNLNIAIVEGLRSFEKQLDYYAQGRTKPGKIITWTRLSWHNFGLAIDVAFLNDSGNFDDKSWSEDHNWKLLGRLGKEAGFVWGGDWKGKEDKPHFQMTFGLTDDDKIKLEKIYNENMSIKDVYNYISNEIGLT